MPNKLKYPCNYMDNNRPYQERLFINSFKGLSPAIHQTNCKKRYANGKPNIDGNIVKQRETKKNLSCSTTVII